MLTAAGPLHFLAISGSSVINFCNEIFKTSFFAAVLIIKNVNIFMSSAVVVEAGKLRNAVPRSAANLDEALSFPTSPLS